jgi:hypothetical protein
MNWYFYVIVVLLMYILTVIVKATIFSRKLRLTKTTDYKGILELESIALEIIFNIVVPFFVFRYLEEVHRRNKQRRREADAAYDEFLRKAVK